MVYSKFPTKPARRIVESLAKVTANSSLRSCVFMTFALSFHFLGYECSRAASITMLAAKDVGLGNEAIPFTIVMGSPLSGLTLYMYTKSIKKFGSKFTLRISFAVCVVLMSWISLLGGSFKGISGKIVVVAFYAFREIYVSLISSQQWAFIAGTLNKTTSSYIVTFSGVVSVASALGGCSIEKLVGYGGLQALLFAAVAALVASYLCSEFAYHMAEQPVSAAQSALTSSTFVTAPSEGNKTGEITHAINTAKTFDNEMGDAEKDQKIKPTSPPESDSLTSEANVIKNNKKGGGFWSDSWSLMSKHRMLQLLFMEGVFHQLCGNMLNLMFHNGLRLEIEDDAARAMLVGRFFATVNITSSTLQCFVLPHVLSQSTLPSVLIQLPLLVFVVTVFGVVYPSLVSVMFSFGTIKVLEYSIMHSASEMIYMPMGHEVRYLGKELIKYFGHKLGKSASSLILSIAVSQLQPSLTVQSLWGALLTLCWGGSMYILSTHVKERDLQEERDTQAVEARRTKSKEMRSRDKARSVSYDDYFVTQNRSSSKSAHITPLLNIPLTNAVGERITVDKQPHGRSISLDKSSNISHTSKPIYDFAVHQVVAVELISEDDGENLNLTDRSDKGNDICVKKVESIVGGSQTLTTVVEADSADALNGCK